MNVPDEQFRKSSRSGGVGCVEVAQLGDIIAVRDSKDRRGPKLIFNAVEWDAFLQGVRAGEFDNRAR